MYESAGIRSDERQAGMERFGAMYRARHFDADGFDLDGGYLQTTLSDEARMPLRFFVEYNNVWWFKIVTAVAVPTAATRPVRSFSPRGRRGLPPQPQRPGLRGDGADGRA